jgi:hypothetical protein
MKKIIISKCGARLTGNKKIDKKEITDNDKNIIDDVEVKK